MEDARKTFLTFAEGAEDLPFVVAESDSLFAEFKISSPAVVMFRKVIYYSLICLRTFESMIFGSIS